MTIYLDTHALLPLAEGQLQKFRRRGLDLMRRSEILASPMTMVELEFLYEIGRIQWTAAAVVGRLMEKAGLRLCARPFGEVAEAALQENWTRDPFDRLIVAQARAARAPLITKDERIQANYSAAVW